MAEITIVNTINQRPPMESKMIEIVVRQAGPGSFEAFVDDKLVGVFREPFLTTARKLAAAGVEPETEIAMRHAGSDVISLRSTVGQAAALTVEENDTVGPRFKPYRPFSR